MLKGAAKTHTENTTQIHPTILSRSERSETRVIVVTRIKP